jgi:PAS domain S-box-containing protein
VNQASSSSSQSGASVATDRLQERINVIASHVPIIIYAVDRNCVYTMHDGQALKNIGLKPGEVVGRKPEEVYPDTPQIAANFRRALAGESFIVMVPLRDRVFDAWYSPIKDTNGVVIGVTGVAYDVTERQQMTENLQRVLSLTEATLESTADGLMVVNLEGKIIRYNRKLVEMWHIPEDIMAQADDIRTLNYIPGQVVDRAWLLGRLAAINSAPESSSQDIVELRDGRLFDCYSQPQRLNGAVIGRVWSFRDITARHLVETELETRNRELEKTAHFLSGREKHLGELKKELRELQQKCGIVKDDKVE